MTTTRTARRTPTFADLPVGARCYKGQGKQVWIVTGRGEYCGDEWVALAKETSEAAKLAVATGKPVKGSNAMYGPASLTVDVVVDTAAVEASDAAKVEWAARFERAEWVAPYDCSDGTPKGSTKLGWVCPSCGGLEVNSYLLSMNHGYDPRIVGRQPFQGWGTECTRTMLLASQERSRVAREAKAAEGMLPVAEVETDAACEDCGHRTSTHYRPEHVRADKLTCRAFTCRCTHRPGEALVAPKPARRAKAAKATAAAVAPAKRADAQRATGRVYASGLAGGQRVALRGHGEVAVLRVESWEPRKVLVTLDDAEQTQLVMGSWAWVRLAA